ncbi:SARP family transcriptional regulator [Actinoalloteichus sp. AHMU CJ021]|uniref:AfsR/SARP family transcriptional regulator n=1 Tax=Actinoalloteichus sp. AHMU CJ021 TaxID=2072503 RepID=UPI000CA05662|nr:SARP family transcriptional regulator [Actinoalloteichus sp. AHMU CJ021]
MLNGDDTPGGQPGARFLLLGPVEVTVDGRPVPLGSRAVRSVLALLLLNRGTVVPTERIAEMLWGHSPPASARTILHGYVSRLRRQLAALPGDSPADIRTKPPGYRLEVDGALIDLVRARDLAASAGADADDAPGPDRRARLLRQALKLWRGPSLGDLSDEGVLGSMAHSIEEFRLDLVEQRVAADLELGREGLVTAELVRLLDEHPLRERMAAHLLVALYRLGRRADAVARYQDIRRRLREEFGVDPSPHLQRTYERVLRDDPLLLGSGNRPAIAAGRDAAAPRQLPPEVGGFTGRARELARLRELWERRRPTEAERAGSGPRIVVLAGPPGAGKSALAVTWAHRVRHHYPDGQLFVHLGGADGRNGPVPPDSALRQLLVGLGVRDRDVPAGVAERAAAFRSSAADRRLLLVFDDAASTEQVLPLLPAGRDCLVLVTSRRRLEGLVVRSGAALLPLGMLAEDDAVELLAGALRDVGGEIDGTNTDTVVELVRLCGGLPLALRIVAARIIAGGGSGLATLLSELGDERDRLVRLAVEDDEISVRGAFDVSYRDLPPDHADVFRLVGAHPGSEMTDHVLAAMAGRPVREVSVVVDELASRHLVDRVTPDRVGAHDLLRLYARQLDVPDTGPGSSPRHRMVAYYLAASERAREALQLSSQPVRLEPLAPEVELPELGDAVSWYDREWANLGQAVATAEALGEHRRVWRLIWSLMPYVRFRHLLDEAGGLFERGLAAARQDGDRLGECLMLRGQVSVALYGSTGLPAALDRAVAASEIAEELAGPELVAATVADLFTVRVQLGLFEEARSVGERTLTLYRELGDVAGQAMALNNLALLDQNEGRLDSAFARCLAVRELYRITGRPFHEAVALNNLAELAGELRRWDAARDYAEAALRVAGGCGATVQEGKALISLGDVHRASGDEELALATWRRAEELLRPTSSPILREAEQRIAEAS